jgi:hypothetical protein
MPWKYIMLGTPGWWILHVIAIALVLYAGYASRF